MTASSCDGCGLPASYCACAGIEPCQPRIRFALLLHENEPERPSNTSRLIRRLFPDTQCYIWHRTAFPPALNNLITDSRYQPWLLFPADRPELLPRARQWQHPQDRTALVIIPDGTWKEVRKIVRKSPELAGLPLISFSPQRSSRYKLRRNPDADHLCTAEIAAELLRATGDSHAADALDQLLTRFLHHYHHWQHHLPLSQTETHLHIGTT